MPLEPLILAFDTSAAHCAVALLLGDHCLENRQEEMAKGQAERLFPLLEEVLTSHGKTWKDLDAIACGTGPGNFTGIRISVASARGLALSLGVPAIGVDRFEAMALGLPRPTLVGIDARRGECFFALISNDQNRQIWTAKPDDLVTRPIPHAVRFIGQADGLPKDLDAQIQSAKYPLAEAVARIAAARMGDENPLPAPLYLKAPDAAPSRDAPPVILS